MIGLLLLIVAFTRLVRNALKDPPFRALAGSVVIVLAAGTTFYSLVEGWGVLDSLYFSVVTLTTVGLGDLAPQTAPGKVFTIFYVLIGLGFVGAFITATVERSKLWSRAGLAGGEGAKGSDASAEARNLDS